MSNNEKATLLATWSTGTDEYRVIVRPNRYDNDKCYVIEKMYRDGLGEPAWRECGGGENLEQSILDLFRALKNGKYELIKKS